MPRTTPKHEGATPIGKRVVLVSPEMGIDDDLKRDILGARKKILFVEGTERSLDKPLYSLLFPNVSIVAKSSCRDVEHAVSGIRDANDLHWVHAFGIVDSDRRSQDNIDKLLAKGIFAVPFYSVESIYYHPEVQRRIAKRQETTNGVDAENSLQNAKFAVLSAIKQHVQRLSERVAEKEVRERLLQHLPRQKDLVEGKPINVAIDVAAIVSDERTRLDTAIAGGDIQKIIARYPIRETPALDEIAKSLDFQTRKKYEIAVRKLFSDDPDAIQFARSLFGNLAAELDAK